MSLSERTHHSTEVYLRKHGCDPENLNDKQWDIIATEVKHLRHSKWALTLLVVSCIATAIATLASFAQNQSRIDKLADQKMIMYLAVAEDREQMLQPYQMRDYVDSLAENSFNVGILFTVPAVMLLSCIIVMIHSRERRKVIEAFLPHISSDDNPAI